MTPTHPLASPPAATERAPRAPAPSRRTVDAVTRSLHALLILSFALAWISGDTERFRGLHVVMGYTLGLTLLLRVLWGFAGPPAVRWRTLALRLKSPWQRLRQGDLAGAWPVLRQGLLTLSVVLLLGLIVPLVLSGYATDQSLAGEWLEEVHEAFGNAMLMALLAHVALVLLSVLGGRRHLLGSMVHGRMPGPGPDLVRGWRDRALAGLLWLAALGFWGWQWQVLQSPQDWPGLAWMHSGAAQSGQADRHRDRDDDHDD
ncbi:MAG: hypothetical protein RIQ97_593 [Pseudomonadota bacterium]